MEIISLWKTSKGLFRDEDEAMLEKNRQPVSGGFGTMVLSLEEPQEITALTWVDPDFVRKYSVLTLSSVVGG